MRADAVDRFKGEGLFVLDHFLFLLAFDGFADAVAHGDAVVVRRQKGTGEFPAALELELDLAAEGLAVLGRYLKGLVEAGGGDGEGVVLDVLVEACVEGPVDGDAVVHGDFARLLFHRDGDVVVCADADPDEEAPARLDGGGNGADDGLFVHIL